MIKTFIDRCKYVHLVEAAGWKFRSALFTDRLDVIGISRLTTKQNLILQKIYKKI